MRGIQYSDFVEVFNCLTALESNLGDNDSIRTGVAEPESELGVGVEGVKGFYGESESESKKGFYQSRSQSRKKDFARVGVRVEKRILPELGVGVRVEKYMLDSQCCSKI